MQREEYLARWSVLHGGVDTTGPGLVRGWLVMTHALARPLAAARVPPDTVTLAGLAVALLLVPVALAGDRWLLAAVPVVVVSGVVDNLDGAVALMQGRTTRWGWVLDSLVDRCTDTVYVVALHLVGAPGWLAATAAGVALLHEYVRARAGSAGMREVGAVTVAERPTRVVVTVMFLLGAGLYPGAAAQWATAGASAWATIGAVGLVQLLVVVRRRLAEP